jgi:hypothetical protein
VRNCARPVHLSSGSILSYVDDGIHFPILPVDVPLAHGKRLRNAYGRGAPLVPPIAYKAVSR